jgi:hypothetical protein
MQYNKRIKTLIIPHKLNEELKDIPENTKIIIFKKKSKFNQKIDYLPKYFLGFPQNLTHLTFGRNFNKKVNKLSKNLIYLAFGKNFNQEVNNLPKNLKYLKFGCKFQNNFILPNNLKKLSLSNKNFLLNNIPSQIEKLYIWFSYTENYNKKIENLPPTIKEIVIENEKYKKYIKIPFGCILTIKKIE